MRSLVLLGFTTLGAHAAQRHHHRHVQLHARDPVTTVVEVTTAWVTQYVYEDGSPVSTSSSSSSSSSSQNLEAIFIQVATSSSSSSTSTSSTSSTTSTTIITIPSTTTTPAPVVSTSAAPVASSKEGERVFTIINMHTAAISTVHDDTVGAPTSAGSPLVAGTMAAGATATFAVEAGWIGNIGINDANYPVTTDSTLIEANFVEWFGTPRADFDVSFVNGFTLPATCSCSGVTTTGCNLDLKSLSTCPSGIVNNGCANPLRALESATSASSFFSVCEGAAWTYVNDGDADSNCIDGPIVCCIGTGCPANPKQAVLSS